MHPRIGLVVLLLAAHSRLECGAGPESVRKTHPLSVSGRALDADGRPVPGATIFLVSTNGISEMLGQTVADKYGRYAFHELPLPIPELKNRQYFEYGSFRVLGRAPGQACAWRAIKHRYLDPRFRFDPTAPGCGFFPGEDITLDLKFAEPYTVSGQVIDEGGNPIAGAKVTISDCSFFDKWGDESQSTNRDFLSLHEETGFLPQDFKTESDAAGQFAFQSVARDRYCWFSIAHPDYMGASVRVAASDNPPRNDDDQFLRSLPVTMTLQWMPRQRTHAIAVRVIWADTGRAAAGVSVAVAGAQGISDQEGNVVLRLPQGKYRLRGTPPRDTDYIISEQSFQFGEPPATPVDLPISRGATLILRVVDAKTGHGIPDVSMWCLGQQGGRTDIGSMSTPKGFRMTNPDGEIRVVVPSGTRKYGVGAYVGPGDLISDTADARSGRELTIAAGETAMIEFKATVRPDVDVQADDLKTVESNEPESITGQVGYDGPAPPRKMIAGMIGGGNRSRLRIPPAFDDSLQVDAETRGLANVVIYVDRVPSGMAIPAPSKARVVLLAENGQFEPRISVLRPGQTCLFKNNNSGPTNVQITPFHNRGFDQLVARQKTATWRFDKSERLPIPIKSSIRFGMKGYQIVTDHPWVAVTDKTGKFAIRGLPPGKYEFTVWHEITGYLEKSLPVEVKTGAPTKLELRYAPARFSR